MTLSVWLRTQPKPDLVLWLLLALLLSVNAAIAFAPRPHVVLYAMVFGDERSGDITYHGPWNTRHPTDKYYTRDGCLRAVRAWSAVEMENGRTMWFDCVAQDRPKP